MNNAVFGKTMENVRIGRDSKLVKPEKKRNYLISEPIYHTTMFFHRKGISNRNEKNSNTYEPVYLGLSILDLSKNVMYEF